MIVEDRIGDLDDFWRAVNARDFDRAVAHYSPTAVLTMVGREVVGRDAIRAELAGFASAFPDSVNVPHGRIANADGSVVVEEWSMRGTHLGTFLGRPATGAAVAFDAVTLYEFEDGLIARDRTYADMTRLMLAIGAVRKSA